MKIAIAQTSAECADFELNLAKVRGMCLKAKSEGAEIIIFPEMFLCGFNYAKNLDFLKRNRTLAETRLCKIAAESGLYLCGTIPHLEEGDNTPPSNRLLFVNPSGKTEFFYDKIHLFGVFNENKHVKAGNEIVVADTSFGKIGFAVCYDIRFPDMFVNMAKRGAKLVVICAAFPHPRSRHWQILTRARAIENQIFVAAVNKAGTETLGTKTLKYFGLSAVIDPWGNTVAECGEDTTDKLAVADIDLRDVEKIRAQIPSFADRRDDIY